MPALPFSREDFFSVFARYNESVWPFQLLALALAGGIVFARRGPHRLRTHAVGALGLLWLWMGIVYHWTFFAPINPVARVFAIFFVAEGLLLLWHGSISGRVAIAPSVSRERGVAAAALIGYALIGYLLIGLAAGQAYPALPTFAASGRPSAYSVER